MVDSSTSNLLERGDPKRSTRQLTNGAHQATYAYGTWPAAN